MAVRIGETGQLELHPFKKRIAPIHQGIDFIGFIHKPYRRQIRVRTASKMISLVHQWKKSKRGLEQESLENLRNSMNSYFGISRWASTYRLRQLLEALMFAASQPPQDLSIF